MLRTEHSPLRTLHTYLKAAGAVRIGVVVSSYVFDVLDFSEIAITACADLIHKTSFMFAIWISKAGLITTAE
jgi:hypothetical protein